MPSVIMRPQPSNHRRLSRRPVSFFSIVAPAAAILLLLYGCWPVPENSGTAPTPEPTSSGAEGRPTNVPFGPAQAPTPLPSESGVLNIALQPDDPASLDPATAADSYSLFLIRQIYSALVTFDDNLNVVPDVAAALPVVSADGKTYTFALRRGVRFPDGQEVTSTDFKYSFERAADPRLAGAEPPSALPAGVYFDDIVGVNDKLAGKTSAISGIQAPDPYTLVLTIDAPKSYFLAKLASGPDFVLERSSVESGADWTEHPKSTGPFSLEKWTHRYQIVLAARDDYFGGRPLLKQVNIWMGAGALSALSQYEAGGLDVSTLSTGEIGRVSDRNNPLSRQLQSADEPGVTYLGFNMRQKPFDDPNIRQALSSVIDRQQLAWTLFRSKVQPATSFVPSGLAGYEPPGIENYYDVTAARQLIADSTYKSLQNLPKLSIYSIGDGLGSLLADVFSRTLGLSVDVHDVDMNDYLDGLSKGAYPMFTLTWDARFPDPLGTLGKLFRSGAADNFTGYRNADVDTALDAATAELDPGKRMAIYAQIEDRILRDYPAVPLYHYARYLLVKPYVRGVRVTPIGILSLKNVSVAER